MGFTAKTVCPECGLTTEQYFEENGFNERNSITVCKCGYAYDNRATAVEVTKDGEETHASIDWAGNHLDKIRNRDAKVKTKCPLCGHVKEYELTYKNLRNLPTVTKCSYCSYLYYTKENTIATW